MPDLSHARPKKGGYGNPIAGAGATGEKARDFKGSIGKLIKYMRGYMIAVIIAMACSAASSVFFVLGPKKMGGATTILAEGIMAKINGDGFIDMPAIGYVLIITIIIYVIGAVFMMVQSLIMAWVTQRVAFNLRRDISEKINRMPLGYFESKATGDVLSTVTNDVDTIGQSLSQTFTTIILSMTTLVGVVIMMLTISPIMTLIAVVMLPLSMGLIALTVKKSQKFFEAQQRHLGILNGQVEENYGGHLVVKAFNREEKATEEFTKENEIMYSSAWKSQFLSGLMQPIMIAIGNLAYVAVAIVGGILAVKGIITIGDIQAFIQYVRSFSQPIQQIAQVINQLQSMAAAAERVFEFLEEPEEVHPEKPVSLPENIEGRVEFENVEFGYDPEQIVLKNVSFTAKPHSKIAIVGPTGSGKTTIVKLLMRFYDINSGAIKIDGVDISKVDRRALRRTFAMVLQDTWLFNGTIMENIRYGRPDATDEEVIEAAKAARAHFFIETLPGGYEMELNEEASNVSQGQKQLITIARAILADRKMLILDEATSSVDTRTEQHIQKAMDHLMKERTSFVIAHRLSTIRNADIILVMEKGDIVEQGTHEELLAKGGYYADLYNSQF